MQRAVQEAFEQALRRRRAALVRDARRCEDALRAGAEEPDSELEARAQTTLADRILARLDDAERREIGAIDAALERIAVGRYGRCEACGRAVETERLAALPEAAWCIECATTREPAGVAASSRLGAGVVPVELALLTDVEVEAYLRDAIARDERIDHEELRVAYRDGVVRLSGTLPSEAQHVIVRHVVLDVVGVRDVVDRIRIDATPWERPERTKPAPGRLAGFVRSAAADVVDSVEEGLPLLAPERPPPEEEP
jgi:RNA polymerase-binding protein DksA